MAGPLVEAITDLIPQLHGIPPFRGDYQPPQFKTVDIRRLNETSFRELQQQVYRNHRHLYALVEPWYNDGNPEAVFPITDREREDRDRFIAAALQNGIPLLVFEQSRKYPQIAEKVGLARGAVYTVRIRDADPIVPAVVEEFLGSYRFWSPREVRQSYAEAWRQVTGPLKEVGVKDVTVAVQQPVFREVRRDYETEELEHLKRLAKGRPRAGEWLAGGLIPTGSVGVLARRLLTAGFDVSLTPISSLDRGLEPKGLSSVSQV